MESERFERGCVGVQDVLDIKALQLYIAVLTYLTKPRPLKLRCQQGLQPQWIVVPRLSPRLWLVSAAIYDNKRSLSQS